MFGFLTYLPTIVFVPHILALLPFLYLMLLNPKYTSNKIYQLITNPKSTISVNTFVVGLLVLVSLLNSAINYEKIEEISQIVPYYIFIPATYYIAKVVKPKQWNWFIILVCLEVGVAIFQYANGIQTFFPDDLHVSKSYNPDLPQEINYIKMHGRKIYEFALSNVPLAMKSALDKSAVSIDKIKKVIIHQANEKMDEAIIHRFYKLYQMPVPDGIMPMSIHKLGNSSVATVPTLLDLVIKGKLEGHEILKGDFILLASVGAGMNINAIVYQY